MHESVLVIAYFDGDPLPGKGKDNSLMRGVVLGNRTTSSSSLASCRVALLRAIRTFSRVALCSRIGVLYVVYGDDGAAMDSKYNCALPVQRLRLLAFAALAFTPAGAAQSSHPCENFNSVGAELGKPFLAQRVTNIVTTAADGSAKSDEYTAAIARDTAGRIRIEHRVLVGFGIISDRAHPLPPLPKDFVPPRETYRQEIQIEIVDCSSGRRLLLLPNSRRALTGEGKNLQVSTTKTHPYTFRFSNSSDRKPDLNLTIEDLGSKEINGVHTRGFKATRLGKESDGDWSGKPVEITETWASDELAVTMLEIHTDNRSKKEIKSTLTNIKFEQPDLSLFEIPAGYKVYPPLTGLPGASPNQKPTSAPK
jgi:hypothetical protein